MSSTDQIYAQIEKDYEVPVADKAMNSLLLFNFNFDDLRQMMDFLVQN